MTNHGKSDKKSDFQRTQNWHICKGSNISITKLNTISQIFWRSQKVFRLYQGWPKRTMPRKYSMPMSWMTGWDSSQGFCKGFWHHWFRVRDGPWRSTKNSSFSIETCSSGSIISLWNSSENPRYINWILRFLGPFRMSRRDNSRWSSSQWASSEFLSLNILPKGVQSKEASSKKSKAADRLCDFWRNVLVLISVLYHTVMGHIRDTLKEKTYQTYRYRKIQLAERPVSVDIGEFETTFQEEKKSDILENEILENLYSENQLSLIFDKNKNM